MCKKGSWCFLTLPLIFVLLFQISLDVHVVLTTRVVLSKFRCLYFRAIIVASVAMPFMLFFSSYSLLLFTLSLFFCCIFHIAILFMLLFLHYCSSHTTTLFMLLIATLHVATFLPLLFSHYCFSHDVLLALLLFLCYHSSCVAILVLLILHCCSSHTIAPLALLFSHCHSSCVSSMC